MLIGVYLWLTEVNLWERSLNLGLAKPCSTQAFSFLCYCHTNTYCSSLFLASCSFSCFPACFYSRFSAQHVFKQPNQVSSHCASVSLEIVCTIASQVFCVVSCAKVLSFLIASFAAMLASSPAASSWPVEVTMQIYMATVQNRLVPVVSTFVNLLSYSCTPNLFMIWWPVIVLPTLQLLQLPPLL